MTKPFSPRELALRVQAVLRRGAAPGAGTADARRCARAPIEVDVAARRARRDGRELSLTVREFDLLAFFMAHPGQAFTRAELMKRVWGWSFGDQSTVTVHVRRLRDKVEEEPSVATAAPDRPGHRLLLGCGSFDGGHPASYLQPVR